MPRLPTSEPLSRRDSPTQPPVSTSEHERSLGDKHSASGWRVWGDVPSDPTPLPADGSLWAWHNTTTDEYKVKLGDGTVHVLAPGVEGEAQDAEQTTATVSVTTTQADRTGASITVTAAGDYLVVGVFDFISTGTGWGEARGYLVINSSSENAYARWADPGANAGLTIVQAWVVTLAASDVIKLQAKKTINAGTLVTQSVNTRISCISINGATGGGGGGGAGSDTTAIHDDTAGEIAAVAEKATPITADLILIEDSADSNNKKRVQLANLPAATTTAKGVSELATAAEAAAGTDSSRVPSVSLLPALIQDSKYVYAADAQASDTYVITLTPAPAAYAAGQLFVFKANTANTGAATLNVNTLGAVAIKKLHDQDLATGDIEAGSIVVVVHDGTVFQMVSQLAQVASSVDSVTDLLENGTWKLFYSNGSGDGTELALGGSGTYLRGGGTAAAPTMANPQIGAELTDLAQGSDKIWIPFNVATDSIFTTLAINALAAPSVQHSFYFYKNGSTLLGEVVMTTSGTRWTATVSAFGFAAGDYLSVRHNTNAQDASESSSHTDEGGRLHAEIY